ncbi:MAG: DNA polymerase III subunit gamma/tau [Nitrospirae bacterium]|nr:DNA polymerase III subunit gamma/tau [Nitrospirota bacterium]
MSYLVLARKWRPQGFDELTGQETLVKTLKNAITGGKVVHAYLFSGPRGVGKTSAARILAKALNCAEGPTASPCGKCPDCLSITTGSSVDVFEIDGASNTQVDNVRDLRETVKYAPSGSRYKIYIIDEIHMLSESAFNALLKTLEEPPPHVIFIFATTAPKKIPATILSRCQHHVFRKVLRGKIKEHLQQISKAENININDTALEMIARAADGSMRDALTMLDQASSFSDDVGENELQMLLGLPEADIILKLSEATLKGDISENLFIIKDLSDRGYDLKPVVKEIVEHFRNLAVVKISGKAGALLEFTESEMEHLSQQASTVSMEELTLLLSQLMKLEAEVKTAANPRYALELGLLRTSFVKGMTSLNDLLEKLEGTTVKGISAKLAVEHKAQAKSSAEDKQTNNKKEANGSLELWHKVIEKLKAEDSLIACKLTEAKVVGLTDAGLTISFNGGMSVLAESVGKNARIIEDALKDITGQRLKLKVVSLPDKNGEKTGEEIKQAILSDPTVRNTLELFNGKLLKIKPLNGSE